MDKEKRFCLSTSTSVPLSPFLNSYSVQFFYFIAFWLANISIWLGLYCSLLLWYALDSSYHHFLCVFSCGQRHLSKWKWKIPFKKYPCMFGCSLSKNHSDVLFCKVKAQTETHWTTEWPAMTKLPISIFILIHLNLTVFPSEYKQSIYQSHECILFFSTMYNKFCIFFF